MPTNPRPPLGRCASLACCWPGSPCDLNQLVGGGKLGQRRLGRKSQHHPWRTNMTPEKKRPERTGFSLHKGKYRITWLVCYVKFQRVSVLSDVGSFGQNRFQEPLRAKIFHWHQVLLLRAYCVCHWCGGWLFLGIEMSWQGDGDGDLHVQRVHGAVGEVSAPFHASANSWKICCKVRKGWEVGEVMGRANHCLLRDG